MSFSTASRRRGLSVCSVFGVGVWGLEFVKQARGVGLTCLMLLDEDLYWEP